MVLPKCSDWLHRLGDLAFKSRRKSPRAGVPRKRWRNFFFPRCEQLEDRTVFHVGTISTFAGGGVGDGTAALDVFLKRPAAIAVDGTGNIYFADREHHRIRMVDAGTGIITTVAGNGSAGYGGDGGAATAASLWSPGGVAVDASGNVFIADTENHRIRMVAAGTGIITTVAGDGVAGYSGDSGAAVLAQLYSPSGIAVDASGNIYVADTFNSRVRHIDTITGIITTVAGDGTIGYSGDGGLAIDAALFYPSAVTVDASGNLFIADTFNSVVREVSAATGIITTIVGIGSYGYSGDGGPAELAELSLPYGLALDASGNLYIADSDNHAIRIVNLSTGIIDTFAGDGSLGFSGDGSAATSAQLANPLGVAVDANGNVFIADSDNKRVRKVAAGSGVITTIAGNGTHGFAGDGSLATNAGLGSPGGVAMDSDNNLYLLDTANHRVRKVDAATGIITTVAGNGQQGYSGDGGPAGSATLSSPYGIAVDADGNLYIADTGNHVVRRVDAITGIITTIAGTGTSGYGGDGGAATAALLNSPYGIAVDASGNILIADTLGHRIRRVDAGTGIITTVAGTGSPGYNGDGSPATSSMLFVPYGIAVDADGNLYIADTFNLRIRKVDAITGTMTTIAGDGNAGYGGDNGLATSATLNYPLGITVDYLGNLYIADTLNNRLRVVSAGSQIISTVAGNGTPGFSGDGANSRFAQLNEPFAVTLDSELNIYISDRGNERIRIVTPFFTTTNITSTANPSVFSQPITFTATITSADGIPTGTVTFLNGTVTLAVETLTSGVATFTPSILPGGVHSITVIYGGDDEFLGSRRTLLQTVIRATTTTSLSSSATSTVYGQPVNFTVTVTTTVNDQIATPTGSVTFFLNSVPFANIPLTSDTVVLSTNTIPVGSHTITVMYSGDTNFRPATLYASNQSGAGSTAQLFTIDTATGVGTLIGALPTTATDIEYNNATGEAFVQAAGSANSGRAFDINSGAGIGGTISTGAQFTGLEWVGSTLYATVITSSGGPSTLRTLDPHTGASTIIGLTGFGPIAGLAYDTATSTMFGITGGVAGNLLTINLGTGVATLIGATGFQAGSLQFGPDGLLYGGGAGTNEGQIYRINPATGASTLLGATGVGIPGSASVTGLTLVGEATSPVMLTVSMASTNTLLTTAPSPPTVFSQPVTFTAQVMAVSPSEGTPSGTVTFTEHGNVLAVGTLSGGFAFFTTSALPVGSHALVATYGGDDGYGPSTSVAHIQVVGNKRSLTATVTSLVNPIVFGQPVAFTATLNAVAPATNALFSGTITFRDGATFLGTAELDSNGVAVFIPTTLPNQVRTHTITAVYGGDANQLAVTSAVFLQTVNKADSTTTLTSNVIHTFPGQVVTLTATVAAVAPGVGSPTGTVTFRNGTTTIGTASVNATTGRATLATSSLGLGTHTITAIYAGSTNFNSSTSGVHSQSVGVPTLASTPVVTSDVNPVPPGQTVTLTVTVTGSGGTPGGFVTFRDGNASLGVRTLDSNGQATFASNSLSVRTHTITAIYSGDGSFLGSTSAIYRQTVAKAVTTTTLTSSQTALVAGETVTFEVTVSSSFDTPVGNVSFRDGSTSLGTAALVNGTATFTTTRLRTGGTHTIRAVYGGNSIFALSTSTAVLHVVTKAATSVAVTSNVSSTFVGQVVTFTATIDVASPGTIGAPAGTVTFKNGTATLGTASVNATTGRATLTRSNLAVGNHTITAIYGGTTAFFGSTSIPHIQSVTVGESTTTTIVGATGYAPNTSFPGQTISITATVIATLTGLGVPAGTVSFRDGATFLGTASVDSNGVAVFTKPLPTASGTHTLTAIYASSTGFSGSTSAGFLHTVNKLDVAGITIETLRYPTSSMVGVQYAFFTVTVQPNTIGPLPSGTVTFMEGTATIGQATLKAGKASWLTFKLTTPGDRTITAVYGSATYNLATSAPLVHTVLGTAPYRRTSITVTSNANPSGPGQLVTFTATVTSNSPGTPNGVVVFLSGTKELARVWLDHNLPVTFTTASLAAGTHRITAVYGGNGYFMETTSAIYFQSVSKATSTDLTFDNTPTVAGQPVVLTATVNSLTIGGPTGTVTFRDDTTLLGTANLVGGMATLTTTALTAQGTHTLRAIYGGDSTFNASTSLPVLHEVQAADTTITLTSNVNPSGYGERVTFTATVTVNSPGTGVPTGTVTIKEGTVTLGTASVNPTTGIAIFTTASLSAGADHTITAIYGGSIAYNSSTSSDYVQTVKPVPTTVITSSAIIVTANTVVNFTVTVSGNAGTPTGSVTFLDGTSNVGSAVLGGGTATFTYTFGTTGLHTLTALYGGDPTYSSSLSAGYVVDVVT